MYKSKASNEALDEVWRRSFLSIYSEQKSIKELVDADIIEREGYARKGYWKIKE